MLCVRLTDAKLPQANLFDHLGHIFSCLGLGDWRLEAAHCGAAQRFKNLPIPAGQKPKRKIPSPSITDWLFIVNWELTRRGYGGTLISAVQE
jgi:hypothetical protein